jgi:predicted transcriptional regulator of viral defense system
VGERWGKWGQGNWWGVDGKGRQVGRRRRPIVRRIAEVFGANGGLATRRQLAAVGVSRRLLTILIRRGLVVRSRRGVYAIGSLAEMAKTDPAQLHALRVAGAIAVVKAEWVASHHSAAIIHGLDLLGRPPDRVVAVTQGKRGGNLSGYRGVRVHVAKIPPGHVTRKFGVPCTSVARTVVDLARSSPFIQGVVVADSALHAGLTTRRRLDEVLTQCARWPGIRDARRVVEFSDRRSESVLESAARVIFHEHGLAPPDLQAWVGSQDDPRIGRVDFLWAEHRTIAEADGKAKYKDQELAVRQLRRDSRLRDAGFEVVHFTWAEIFYEPERVIGRILAAFDRAARLNEERR